MGGRHELRHVLPGWFEGSLRYLELYSEVMKRGPWKTGESTGAREVDQGPGEVGGSGGSSVLPVACAV